MNCARCGGELRIEDAVCPQCGEVNPYYEEHRGHMEQYGQEYARTKQEVLTKTGIITARMWWIALIAILAAAEVVLVVLGNQAETVYSAYKQMQTERRISDYVRQCVAYAEQGDYFSFENYYWAMGLNDYTGYGDVMYEYRDLEMIISEYNQAVPELWYLAVDAADYDSSIRASYLDYLADCFYWLYYYLNTDYSINGYNETHIQTAQNIREELTAMLVTYAGLDAETAAGYGNMTYEEQLAVLKEGIIKDEE